MQEPRVIRYFTKEESAIAACEKVRQEGFECEVIEDKFNNVSLDKFRMRRRFKIVVERKDVYKVAETIAKKLSK